MYALITGSSSGLGFHIAKELKTRGYDLILISRNEEKLKIAAEMLHSSIYYPIDLSKDYKKVGDIIEEFKPQVVVNNAGFGMYGELENQEWERIEDMINLNILALTYITKKAVEVLDEGYILNVSSVAACHSQPNLSVYAATKSYVAMFSRSLAKEINGRKELKISYLLLGPTRTNFFKNAGMPTNGIEKIMLSPEKVAKYAVKKMFEGKRRIVPGVIFKLYCL